MRVAFQRDRRIFVSENLGERSDVHAALDRAGGKRVSERVKPSVRDIQFFKQQFETPLVTSHRNGIAARGHHEVGIAVFLYAF